MGLWIGYTEFSADTSLKDVAAPQYDELHELTRKTFENDSH